MKHKLGKRAYIVEERHGDGDCSIVVFATSDHEARKLAMCTDELEDILYIDISARREPTFDEYAARGEVPVEAYLEYGWWLPCSGYCCGTQLTQEDVDTGYAFIVEGKLLCSGCKEKAEATS